ncbi:hypothetical protein EBZ39_00225 [bacterium]|nr:hypothetical protein [bacterium]
MSIQDYAKRKYDFLAFRNVAPGRERQLGLALYSEDDNGQICVGIQKLAQRWALEFLTETGSLRGLPDRGSSFMAALRLRNLRTPQDITFAFNAANLEIERQLKNEEYDTMPDDEKFKTAALTGVTFYPGYLSLSVMIESQAGTSRAAILPIATLP